MTVNHYIIDSSSLIDLQRFYPMSVFPTLWKNLSVLIQKRLLNSPQEVFSEIAVKDDTVKEWVKKQTNFFIEITNFQINIVREVVSKFPSLVKQLQPFNADPWLIAVAYEFIKFPQKSIAEFISHQDFNERVVTIVTEESLRGNKVKIPFVAQQYNIPCMKVLDVIKAEGWTF
ncbi:MAG: DUF4411 family protein [Candidatus Heimdallarchaeota archaeon]